MSTLVYIALAVVVVLIIVATFGVYVLKHTGSTNSKMDDQEDVIVELRKRTDMLADKTKETLVQQRSLGEAKDGIYSDIDVIMAKLESKADISPTEINSVVSQIREVKESVKEIQNILKEQGKELEKTIPEESLPVFRQCTSETDSDVPDYRDRRVIQKPDKKKVQKRRSRHDSVN